jgi:hypothetical protein
VPRKSARRARGILSDVISSSVYKFLRPELYSLDPPLRWWAQVFLTVAPRWRRFVRGAWPLPATRPCGSCVRRHDRVPAPRRRAVAARKTSRRRPQRDVLAAESQGGKWGSVLRRPPNISAKVRTTRVARCCRAGDWRWYIENTSLSGRTWLKVLTWVSACILLPLFPPPQSIVRYIRTVAVSCKSACTKRMPPHTRPSCGCWMS